jgi:mono/diheme cytochrome c family protein
MQSRWRGVLFAVFCVVLVAIVPRAGSPASRVREASGQALGMMRLHDSRESPWDLEVAGDLAGAPAGAVRYFRRKDLEALGTETFLVRNDANFTAPVNVSGVPLATLLQLSGHPQTDMVVAICDDGYRANYRRSYIEVHAPVLALLIDGRPPAGWPKDSETHKMDLGPFLITHPDFRPAYKVLGQEEEAQIPWGVVRLEFRDEASVYGAIAPRGPRASDTAVQDGYRIAQQNCFRCHNSGGEDGQKAQRPWGVLATWAAASPDHFAAYVRNPRAVNAKSQMPGNAGFDDATMHALTAYFQTFAGQSPTQRKP